MNKEYEQVREDIAKSIALDRHLCEWTNWETLPQVYKDKVFYPLADKILSHPRIAEGLKLLEAKEKGKLAVLAENQDLSEGDFPYLAGDICADCEAYEIAQKDMTTPSKGYKWVKVLVDEA